MGGTGGWRKTVQKHGKDLKNWRMEEDGESTRAGVRRRGGEGGARR